MRCTEVRDRERNTRHLDRVDDAGLEHVAVRVVRRVVAERTGALEHALDNDRAIHAGIRSDVADRRLTRLLHDLHAEAGVEIGLERVEHLRGAEQRNTTTGDDSLFDGRTCRVQRVFHTCLLLLHLDFGRSTDADHRDAANKLGQTLLKLLTIVVARRRRHLRLDLCHAVVDRLLVASAVDDRRGILRDTHLGRAAEI
jgi:hypothetical protein